jgi:hypothetical protein
MDPLQLLGNSLDRAGMQSALCVQSHLQGMCGSDRTLPPRIILVFARFGSIGLGLLEDDQVLIIQRASWDMTADI